MQSCKFIQVKVGAKSIKSKSLSRNNDLELVCSVILLYFLLSSSILHVAFAGVDTAHMSNVAGMTGS